MAAPIDFEEALQRVISNTPRAPLERVPLGYALGRVLADNALADRDWPPFNRSAVDGYALLSSDTANGSGELEVIEEVCAGQIASKKITTGKAIRIMTGAPVPEGADSVIMQEYTETPRVGFVQFKMALPAGRNISRQGEDARTGQTVIPKGTPISAAVIGILAAVGCVPVPVYRLPRIAVFGTGNEIVEPHETPGPAQIRNSNSHQLLAQCAELGFAADYLGIARDDKASTLALLQRAMQYDVVLSTGGVSVGAHDHVGSVMQEMGVEIVFNKVAIKPGKPTTFGRLSRPDGQTLFFGLPGNPVAAFVCFHLFVKTALRQFSGTAQSKPQAQKLRLRTSLKPPGDRATFLPSRLVTDATGTYVEPIKWHGSGHLAALVEATGVCLHRPGESLNSGDFVTYYPF